MRFPLIMATTLVAALVTAPIAVASAAAASPVTHHATPAPAYGATWTVDTATNSLAEYAPAASGTATPIATITGLSTDLSGPTAVGVGSGGNVYVTNATSNSITEYAAGATGDAAPIATIAGSATGLDAPSSIAVAGGQVWVTDPPSNVVEAFSGGSNGNVLPAESISGPKTQLDHPIALTVQSEISLISVLNAPISGATSITTYLGFLTQYGNVAPFARILGAKGHPLASPTAMVSASFGAVWVADAANNSITEYFAVERGAPALATISGAATKLDSPSALTIDAAGQLVVANGGDHSVSVFGQRSHGNIAPLRHFTTTDSDAGSPAALAAVGARPGSPTDVQAVAHNGSATVHWRAPTVTGGGIVGYDVSTVSRTEFGGSGDGSGTIISIGGDETSTTGTTVTMHHLRNGTKYHFQIQAVNVFGASAPGTSNVVTPLTVPSAPSNVVAIGGASAISVGWTKPKQNGGDRITHYRVEYATCSPGALGCAFRSALVAPIHRHVHITGLKAGTRYRIRVVAQSAVGNGHPSRTIFATTS
jgi:hypothetical protein